MTPTQADTVMATQTSQDLLWWPEFHSTVSIVALILGILVFVIAYFAGGVENKSKLLFSTTLAVLIGFLSMPLFIDFFAWLGILDSAYGKLSLFVLLIMFVAGLSCHSYEIVTVSAREARPPV